MQSATPGTLASVVHWGGLPASSVWVLPLNVELRNLYARVRVRVRVRVS